MSAVFLQIWQAGRSSHSCRMATIDANDRHILHECGGRGRSPGTICLTRPVFHAQALDARKLAGIVGNDHEIPRLCLTGDKCVIGTDGRPLGGKGRPYISSDVRIPLVEIEDWKIGEQ